MERITQEAYYRQRLITYAQKHGAAEAALRYKCSRKTVYKWLKRYEGSIESLKERSRKPHKSPNAQSEAELEMVLKEYERDKAGDKLVMWHKCCKQGYERKYRTFLRTIRRHEGNTKKRKRKASAQEYRTATSPGEKMQADVKYVPSECVKDGAKYYQYTMIDEYTRRCVHDRYEEKSTYSSWLFLQKAIRFYEEKGISVKHIQTDNGTEWTNALLANDAVDKTLWEEQAQAFGIVLSRIRIATPWHTGNVDRQHRKEGQRFYRTLSMSSLEEGRKTLATYRKESLYYPITSLGFKCPIDVLQEYNSRVGRAILQ